MSLEDYHRKREFNITPEPDGSGESSENQFRFVIQKHHARNLHYDLRLELEGTLKSWAVPKGPSLDPNDKRLAIHVEDHPLEYLDFEGIIPKGEYGAGTVIVWDIGTWRPINDGYADYQKGELKFALDGHKLQGRWMLVRTGKPDSGNAAHWLFFKERDEVARPKDQFDILVEYPASVISGRSLEEVANDADVVWKGQGTSFYENEQDAMAKDRSPTPRTSKQEQKPKESGQASVGSPLKPSQVFSPAKHEKARRTSMPDIPVPALPIASRTAPEGDQWLHEIKFDGYRMFARISASKSGPRSVQFLSRSGKDWTDKLRTLTSQVAKLPVRDAIVDGEVVMMSSDGTTSFQALQNRIGAGRDSQLRYYVFDILHLNGYDLKGLEVEARKEILERVIHGVDSDGALMFSEHIRGNGDMVFKQACKLGAEGIVSKRADSRYATGRITNWIKTKCLNSREFIVGGYTEPTGSRYGFGALVIGVLDEDGQLCYAGRVGTGFTDKTLESLKSLLDQLEQESCPFAMGAEREKRDVHWVAPQLIIEVEFGGWTDAGLVRFPAYRGLRDDLTYDDVEPLPREPAAGDDKSSQPSSKSTKKTRRGKRPSASPTNQSPQSETEFNSKSAGLSSRMLETPGLADLRLTHPDRIVYQEAGITKLGVATYYAQVAEWMLPQVVGRAMSLLRCPKGCHERCFFQKRAPIGLADAVEQVEMPTSEGPKPHLVIHDVVGLLALVQFGVLEFHVWSSKANEPNKPDRVFFDLDPDPSVPWNQVISAAFELQERLEALGLTSFVKVTGGKGFHIVVPIRRRNDWETTREFSEAMSSLMVKQSPGRYTNSASKAARGGKIYIDCLRNTRGATAIAAYSTRAHKSASISVPLHWNELENLPTASYYTLQNAMRRLNSLDADPWAGMLEASQSITKKMMQSLRTS